MKIMTVLGTRPEIIRLSRIIPKLDQLVDHVLVHTGQNFAYSLNEVFFKQLGVREPDEFMGVREDTYSKQIAKIFIHTEELLSKHKPDRLLILGDTNSGLAAIIAKRAGILVCHMEAGNRCFDDRVPEEINRRLIDHSSDILMPYTEHSRRNLLSEGIAGRRIYVTGNPIREVIDSHRSEIDASPIFDDLDIKPGEYFLVTLHRAENVDIEKRLHAFLDSFAALSKQYGLPVIVSTHPRMKNKLEAFGVNPEGIPGVTFREPFGFFEFLKLELNAKCVLSDSGTVQEECAIYNVPNVTLRDVTERPETIDCGSNILTGADCTNILRAVRIALASGADGWVAPSEYNALNVSDTVARIALGYHHS